MNNPKTCTIVISPCVPWSEGSWRTCGESIRETRTLYHETCLKDVHDFEAKLVKDFESWLRPESRLSIVIRPNYNDGPQTFHEWRSFNGEGFKRVEFKPSFAEEENLMTPDLSKLCDRIGEDMQKLAMEGVFDR